MNEYVLEINGVSKRFPGVLALDNICIKIRPGKVHALAGENGAGKSTLMKCLLGLYQMDEGQIMMDGKTVSFKDVKHARECGLSIIPQELAPVPERSIMENIWLNSEVLKYKIFLDEKKMLAETKKMLDAFSLDLDVKTPMKELTVAQAQMVEIIKAVSFGARVIMLDEPTSAITDREVKVLFGVIKELTQKGVAIIYVSHKMDEIMEIADEVSILRDGRLISTHDIKDVTPKKIISEMVGRDIEESPYSRDKDYGQVVLSLKNLSAGNAFHDVSFDLHKGEILGIAGLVGAGRTELLETIYGLRRKTAGEIYLNGTVSNISNPSDSIESKIAFLPEERRRDGIFPIMSVWENVMIANYKKFLNKARLLNIKGAKDVCNEYIKLLKVKTPSLDTKIENLSGGNQQKVLLARWLLSSPDIFLLDEPTRGIDVGAKSEIYSIILDLVAQGKSILIVSSEMPELIKVCDRIVVMSEGYLTGILNRNEMSQERIMELAADRIH